MNGAAVKVGLQIPAAFDGPMPAKAAYLDFFRHAETLGFDGLWTEDRLFHTANLLEPLSLLTMAAALTERVTLGTAVLLLALRNPAVLARQVSSLEHFSGGRTELGISVGGRPNEYPAAGIAQRERVPRLRENILLLRALLRGEPVTHAGRFSALEDAVVRPPAREGGVPLYMGGRTPPVRRRTAELADGWIDGPFTPLDEFRACWDGIRAHAAALGRDAEALVAGKLIYVAVDDDRERALASLTPFLRAYYGPATEPSQYALYGPSDEVAAALQGFADSGVTTFMLAVPTLDIAHLERIAAEVTPQLRG